MITLKSFERSPHLRAIDNLVLVVPSDPLETEGALRAAAEHAGPVFVRVSRMGVPAVNNHGYRFERNQRPISRCAIDTGDGHLIRQATDLQLLLRAGRCAAPVAQDQDADQLAAEPERQHDERAGAEPGDRVEVAGKLVGPGLQEHQLRAVEQVLHILRAELDTA